MNKKSYRVLGLCYVFLALVFAGLTVFMFPEAHNACASGKVKIADSPCDAEYFKSMVARATLEADREVTQNQNLIYKPDSVLSYTCFERHLGVLGTAATQMFSETMRWGQVLGGNHDVHMNTALEVLVEDALYSYLELNFHGKGNTRYMGGRSTISRDTPDQSVPNGESYTCDVMERVWQEAKCYDFIAIEDTDGFYPFEYYRDQDDLRRLPQPCTSKPPYDTNLTTALLSPPWDDDPTQTYLDRFDAAECGNIAPLPTGVEVQRAVIEPREYNERVCIQPGCHFDPAGGNCVP